MDSRRWRTLKKLENTVETPMLVLGIAWLALLIVEFILGQRPWIERASEAIWVVFVVDFVIKLAIAPRRDVFLRKNWLTLLSLALPALRVFRLLRAARLARIAQGGRHLRLLRVVTSFNRGMRALQRSLGRKGFGYVAILTVVVNLLGAAGMLAFEREVADPGGIHDYGSSLWWTAMGSQYWPQTSEGRMLALLLALYGFAVFGYITATVASFFVGQEEKEEKPAPAPASEVTASELQALRREIEALRAEIAGRRTSVSPGAGT